MCKIYALVGVSPLVMRSSDWQITHWEEGWLIQGRKKINKNQRTWIRVCVLMMFFWSVCRWINCLSFVHVHVTFCGDYSAEEAHPTFFCSSFWCYCVSRTRGLQSGWYSKDCHAVKIYYSSARLKRLDFNHFVPQNEENSPPVCIFWLAVYKLLFGCSNKMQQRQNGGGSFSLTGTVWPIKNNKNKKEDPLWLHY